MPILVCEERRKDIIGNLPILTSLFNPTRCNLPTRHTYDHSEVVLEAANKGERIQAHYYRCAECGAVRVWGFEDTKKND